MRPWPRIEELKRNFSEARPFRHVIADDFLDARFCQRLIDEFPRFDPLHAVHEAGDIGRKGVHANLCTLGSAFRQFDALMRDPAFLKQIVKSRGRRDT